MVSQPRLTMQGPGREIWWLFIKMRALFTSWNSPFICHHYIWSRSQRGKGSSQGERPCWVEAQGIRRDADGMCGGGTRQRALRETVDLVLSKILPWRGCPATHKGADRCEHTSTSQHAELGEGGRQGEAGERGRRKGEGKSFLGSRLVLQTPRSASLTKGNWALKKPLPVLLRSTQFFIKNPTQAKGLPLQRQADLLFWHLCHLLSLQFHFIKLRTSPEAFGMNGEGRTPIHEQVSSLQWWHFIIIRRGDRSPECVPDTGGRAVQTPRRLSARVTSRRVAVRRVGWPLSHWGWGTLPSGATRVCILTLPLRDGTLIRRATSNTSFPLPTMLGDPERRQPQCKNHTHTHTHVHVHVHTHSHAYRTRTKATRSSSTCVIVTIIVTALLERQHKMSCTWVITHFLSPYIYFYIKSKWKSRWNVWIKCTAF